MTSPRSGAGTIRKPQHGPTIEPQDAQGSRRPRGHRLRQPREQRQRIVDASSEIGDGTSWRLTRTPGNVARSSVRFVSSMMCPQSGTTYGSQKLQAHQTETKRPHSLVSATEKGMICVFTVTTELWTKNPESPTRTSGTGVQCRGNEATRLKHKMATNTEDDDDHVGHEPDGRTHATHNKMHPRSTIAFPNPRR